MRRARLAVAVEGACCAGKTTLARRLLADLSHLRVGFVPCYADHVGGGRFLPRPVPRSLAEDRAALRALLSVEADRVAAASTSMVDLLLLDRSVHTLLAHRYAIEQVTGLPCYTPAARTIHRSDRPCWPQLVLHLAVPQTAIEARNGGKFPADSIFLDPNFNAALDAYYATLAEQPGSPVLRLDGTDPVDHLVSVAAARIGRLVEDSRTRGRSPG